MTASGKITWCQKFGSVGAAVALTRLPTGAKSALRLSPAIGLMRYIDRPEANA